MEAFTGNKLCALAQPEVGLNQANLLDRLLDSAVRVGSSTPKADPSGDYTWMMFERAGKLRPGAFDILSAKALQLVGGPNSAPVPKDRSAYGKFMQDRVADVFLTYGTNALLARRELPKLAVVRLPDALSVEATYGMVLMNGAKPQAAGLRDFLFGDEGQAILASHGFASLAR
jgi:molybdate transport system substrate-binding protein